MYTPERIQEKANRIAGDIVNTPDRGSRIQAYRTENCLTQDALGQIMRLRRETISRIEHGKVNPTTDHIHVFSGVIALMEAAKEFRSKNMSVEYPYFSRIGVELGVPPDSIVSLVDLALQSYEQKRKKAIRALEN